ARTVLAAVRSRACRTPQSGQVQERTSRGRESGRCPQAEQRLALRDHWSRATRVRPYHAALYSSWRPNSPQPTSLMALASAWVRTNCLTANASTQITWFSYSRRVVNLCRPSRRWSALRAWIRATFTRAFSRCFDPFCLRARLRWAWASVRSLRCRCLGFATFSPLLSTARSWSLSPTSTPTLAPTTGSAWRASSTRNETKERPAVSREMVTVVGTPAKERDQWISSGATSGC